MDELLDLHFPIVITLDRNFLNLLAYIVIGGLLGYVIGLTLGWGGLAVVLFVALLHFTPDFF